MRFLFRVLVFVYIFLDVLESRGADATLFSGKLEHKTFCVTFFITRFWDFFFKKNQNVGFSKSQNFSNVKKNQNLKNFQLRKNIFSKSYVFWKACILKFSKNITFRKNIFFEVENFSDFDFLKIFYFLKNQHFGFFLRIFFPQNRVEKNDTQNVLCSNFFEN